MGHAAKGVGAGETKGARPRKQHKEPTRAGPHSAGYTGRRNRLWTPATPGVNYARVPAGVGKDVRSGRPRGRIGTAAPTLSATVRPPRETYVKVDGE